MSTNTIHLFFANLKERIKHQCSSTLVLGDQVFIGNAVVLGKHYSDGCDFIAPTRGDCARMLLLIQVVYYLPELFCIPMFSTTYFFEGEKSTVKKPRLVQIV